MLFGALLTVSTAKLVKLGIVFGVLALLHALFRNQVHRITERMQAGELAKLEWKDQAWNFFFYLSIGLAMVFAVRIGGVHPVFSYLVVPAVRSLMVFRRRWIIVLVALFNGALASLAGLWFSYTFDFPAGPAIVATFGIIFLGAVMYRLFWPKMVKSVR